MNNCPRFPRTAQDNPQAAAAALPPLLRQLADRLGVTDLCYNYDLRTLEPWVGEQADRQALIRRMAKRRHLFTSSRRALKLWQDHANHYQYAQDQLEAMFTPGHHLWRLRQPGCPLRRAMAHHGYRHKLTLTLPCPLSSEMSGRFALLMADDHQLEQIESRLEELETLLETVNDRVVLAFSTAINPLVDYKIVSPVSCYILKLLAAGLSREEMAESMGMTQRGIDYHIANLKASIQVRNLAHLIATGGRLRLI